MPLHRYLRLFLMLGFLLIAILRAEPAHAQTAPHDFNIPPQALASALKIYAQETSLQLLYPSEIVQGLQSKGVVGKHTPQDALTTLLQGTGLSFQFSDQNTVTLSKAADTGQQENPASKTLRIEETQVTAEREQEREREYAVRDTTTATKTDTPTFDLPVSVQVVPHEVLADQQVIRLQDALKNVSGVYQAFNSGIGELSYGLRGFDQDTQYEDGFRLPFAPPQETAHLERIEVLKGPASVLYGRIEPGGLVNLVTKRPLATPYYSLQQQIGSFDFYRTTADVTGPLTDDGALLYRFNFAYENAGSFRDFIDSERVFAVGEREGNNENTFQLPDYVRVDLMAAYKWQLWSSTLTAQLNIENLADEEYFNPAAPFQSFVAPGAPRTFIGSLRLEF